MIAEHRFVTTLEGSEAIAIASELARAMGFSVEHADDAGLDAERGLAKPAKAKRYDELPQRVQITYDRGLMNLAASITPHRKADGLHRAIVTNALSVFEQVIAQGEDAQAALAPWHGLCARIDRKAKRQSKNRTLVITLVVAFIVLSFGFLILMVALM